MNIEIPDSILIDATSAALMRRTEYGAVQGPLATAAARAVAAVQDEVASAIEAALREVFARPETLTALRAACLEGAIKAARDKGRAAVRRAKLDPEQVALWARPTRIVEGQP